MPTIALFGSFDGLHPGHDHLLRQANEYGDVVVILAQDDVIRRLKRREPHLSFEERAKALKAHPAVFRVRPSDAQEGEYLALLEEQPDIIGFGYDQHALREDFLAWKEKTGYHGEVVTFAPFEEGKYKTSLLVKI